MLNFFYIKKSILFTKFDLNLPPTSAVLGQRTDPYL